MQLKPFKRPLRDAAMQWSFPALPSRYTPGADAGYLWKAAPAVVLISAVICFAFFIGSPSSLVKKDPMEVSPLSRGVISQLLSASLQDGLRFFHPPLPATPSAPLTSGFPLRESDRLTTFRRCTRVG